jgi:hypothetical protein
MKIKLSIAIFILLSFLNMGAISNNFYNKQNLFNILESQVKSISQFEENGVKLQYRTKEDINKEAVRIREYLTQNVSVNYLEDNKNQFEISNKDFNISVKIWCEDDYNYVEIVIVNKNSKYSTMSLVNILKGLENQELENVEYFSYYEGKYLDNDYSIDKLISENGLQKTKILKINNGYTGTGYLGNNDKINFALIKYDTGSHIIIGTPIIFTTY